MSLMHCGTALFDRREHIWQCVHNLLLLPLCGLYTSARSKLRHECIKTLFDTNTRVDYRVIFGGVFDRMAKQVAHGVHSVNVVLIDVLQVGLVDELYDSYGPLCWVIVLFVLPVAKDWDNHDLVDSLDSSRNVVDALQEVLHLCHVVAMDNLACVEGLARDSEGVGV